MVEGGAGAGDPGVETPVAPVPVFFSVDVVVELPWVPEEQPVSSMSAMRVMSIVFKVFLPRDWAANPWGAPAGTPVISLGVITFGQWVVQIRLSWREAGEVVACCRS